MATPIDYAALRVKVELALREVRQHLVEARRAGTPVEVPEEAAQHIALAEQALDLGTQDLIRKAAVAFGLIEEDAPAPAPAAESPSQDSSSVQTDDTKGTTDQKTDPGAGASSGT